MVKGSDPTVAGAVAPVEVSLSGEAPIAGRYRIVRWLGGGGMGGVYAAHDVELGVEVALKVLHPTTSEQAIERFRSEVRLTRQIQHRNVARMYDIGTHGGQKFLTMELIDGEPLSDELARGPMPWARLQVVADQICAGLAAAHALGIIHRDLKPANVMLERATGRAVITDFGIARRAADPGVTQAGIVVGTPSYMAPEHLAGEELDARADLFAFAVMFYELATGARPWRGDSPIAIAVAQATTPAAPLIAPGIPAAVTAVIDACLRLDRLARPSSATEIRAALGADGPIVTAAAASTPKQHAGSRATTVAVMPIRSAPADQYIAEGVFEDLIDSLSLTPKVRVRPAGGATGQEVDPVEIGRRLEVDHVVVGSLRRLPTGLRISARMTNVSDGFQVWSKSVDTTDAEVLVVSHELARGIASALSTHVTAENRPTDPRAVELFLRARAALRRFGGEHASSAADLLAEALSLAPDSPQIAGALAYATVQAWILIGEPAQAARARDAIGLGLRTGHGEAYLASAMFKLNLGDPIGGAADLATALARAPMSGPAHETTARILGEVGPIEDAIKRFETAAGLDPSRAPAIESELARLDELRGDTAAVARRLAALAADPDPGVAVLGLMWDVRLASWRGDIAGSIAAADRALPHLGHVPARLVKFARDSLAKRAIDEDAWERLVDVQIGDDRPKRIRVLGLQILAEVAVAIGAIDPAVSALASAAQVGLIDVNWLDRCALFRPLVDHPKWREIRDQVAARAAAVHAAVLAR